MNLSLFARWKFSCDLVIDPLFVSETQHGGFRGPCGVARDRA